MIPAAESSAAAALARVQRIALVLAAVGFAALIAGGLAAPARALTNLLVGAFLCLGIAVGGVLVLALNTVARAGWHVVAKRLLEGFGAFVPVGALVLLAVLGPGLPVLYEWARPTHDPLLAAKSSYLNVPFFLGRALLVLGVWSLFAGKLRALSRRQDEGGADGGRAVRWSAGFVVIFAITFCMAAFDWLMSLEARWFSTIFGLYNVAGVLASTMAALSIAAVLLSRAGLLPGLGAAHLHDMGKLLFGFCTLWGYLWFSQFMLIWYANLPEETQYYEARWHGGWQPVFFAVLALGWALPFLLLLPRKAKRNPGHLMRVAVLVLVGRWLDLYLMAAPANLPERPLLPGLLELGGVLGPLGLFVFWTARTFGRVPLLPKGDPYLAESLHHHG